MSETQNHSNHFAGYLTEFFDRSVSEDKSSEMSRPTSQHRLSFGASSIPVRNTYNRSHSHTVSSGSINANGRIGRRKSSTFGTGVNAAAIGAALESAVADGSVAATSSRTPASKAALAALNGTSEAMRRRAHMLYAACHPSSPQ